MKLIFWALHRSQKCKFSGDSKIPFWSALAPRGNQKVNFQLRFVDSWAPGRPFWREPSPPYPPSRRTIVLRTTPPSTHFRGPWGGVGPNNRSCCWLGGWVRNWIIKLDHEICQINDSNLLTHVLCQSIDPILCFRSNSSIQFSVCVPIFRSTFPIQYFGQPAGLPHSLSS